jgi:hypothetical protein
MPFLAADFATSRRLVRKFKKLRQKTLSRLRSDPNDLAIKNAATRNDAASPAAVLARCQLTFSSCARYRSGLRAAPFSAQAYGLAVLLLPFRGSFIGKASHMSAVVSSRERCPRVASSFSERAKLDQRCYRAPEPALEPFLRCYCLPIAWTASSSTALRAILLCSQSPPAFRRFWSNCDKHHGIVRNPTSGKPNAGAKPHALPVHPWSRPRG